MNPHGDIAEAIRPLQLWGLLSGVVGAALLALGYFVAPGAFFPAYLVAFLFWLGISLGCLAISMIHHLSGGGWGFSIRRILEAGYSVLPLMALLFLPLLLGLETLYPWARPEVVEHDEIIRKKIAYLNVSGFMIRAAVYFTVWIVVGLALNFMTAGTDPADEYPRRRRLALFSGPGLVLWVLTVTFAAVDWAMSLEPHWYSSMYGVLFMGGQGVSGLALAIITLVLIAAPRTVPAPPAELHSDVIGTPVEPQAPLRDEAGINPIAAMYSPSRQHDLGNLLLAFVLFWSYVSFAQYLIIWSGNLPEEAPWYLGRTVGGWQYVAIAIIGLHFVLPFLLLLARQTKRQPQWLLRIAGLLLIMRLVDLYWMVMPAFSPQQLTLHWLNIVAPLAIGGLWLAAFAWRLTARGQLPVFDVPPEEEEEPHAVRQPAH